MNLAKQIISTDKTIKSDATVILMILTLNL